VAVKLPVIFPKREIYTLRKGLFYYEYKKRHSAKRSSKSRAGLNQSGGSQTRFSGSRDTEPQVLRLAHKQTEKFNRRKHMATTYMTAEGLQKLKEELQFLEGTERPRVIAAIAEARDKGDLSENAEYDAAKEEQGHLESKIAHLKAKIMDARIIDETTINTNEVQILTRVRVRNLKNGAEKVYQLVTEGEANIMEGKIAVTTPIAKGLMGKKVGEIAEVMVPAGKMEFEILEISL
jgi:transcription elongation factor GreA